MQRYSRRVEPERGREVKHRRHGAATNHERSHRVERDHELSAVELDGPGRELDDVNEPRHLFSCARVHWRKAGMS